MRKIIIRLDDICPDMNYEKFANVRDILFEYDVKPLIGIIPYNKDEKLKEYRKESSKTDEDIWDELVALQNKEGWEVALHGYEHLYKTKNGGIMKRNSKSEFAGISFEEQKIAIKEGKKKLESLGFICKAFMAPSHSFDDNTIKVIDQLNICVITDGKGIFPYEVNGCILMPVPYSIYRDLPFGIYTICLHTNTMSHDDIENIRKFISQRRKSMITLSEGINEYNSLKYKKWINIVNQISNSLMLIGVRCAEIMSKMRQKIG